MITLNASYDHPADGFIPFLSIVKHGVKHSEMRASTSTLSDTHGQGILSEDNRRDLRGNRRRMATTFAPTITALEA